MNYWDLTCVRFLSSGFRADVREVVNVQLSPKMFSWSNCGYFIILGQTGFYKMTLPAI